MTIDETVYHEYANWKLENEVLIKDLKLNADSIYFRLKHVIEVIDYYYDKLIDDKNFSEEDDVIFKTGFYYIVDQVEDIKNLMKKVYSNKINDLEIHAKDINLFLNTIDFQTEVLNTELTSDKDIERLLNIDQDIFEYINKKEDVPESYYLELDSLTTKIFQKLSIDYYPIANIFLEIADELNILD